MKKYLLEITRAIRAERPSEAQIESDSANATLGNEAGVLQHKTQDNFFLLNREHDLQQNVDRILSTMQFNPFAMSMGHGWRVIEYPHSDKCTYDTGHHSSTSIDDMSGEEITTYASVWIQTLQETSASTESWSGASAMTDALAYIETLNASDGWILGQEWRKTIVIDSRPSLWIPAEGYIPSRGSEVNPALGRTDTDRY